MELSAQDRREDNLIRENNNLKQRVKELSLENSKLLKEIDNLQEIILDLNDD